MIQDLPKSLLEDSRKLLQQGADYEKFFKAALKKFGVSSPADFKSDEEKKKFFDYVDKNYKGEKSESVKKYSRSYRLDEASLNYVYFDKSEATRFANKVKSFVDSVDIEKSVAGHFNVLVKGDKKGLKKATDVAIKMSESVESVQEEVTDKDIKNIQKFEKQAGSQLSKMIKAYEKIVKSADKDTRSKMDGFTGNLYAAEDELRMIKNDLENAKVDQDTAKRKADPKNKANMARLGKKLGVNEEEHTSLNIQEGKKGKYKSKKMSKISQGIKKVISIEKKNGADVKDIQQLEKFIKSGLETEMYDDMEILTDRSLKQLDKLMSKLDTDPRDGVAQAIEKADPDLYDMMFGY